MKRKTIQTDVYAEVTDSIIKLLEEGTRPWSPSWANSAAALPLRHEGTPYRGINILLLWAESMAKGYSNPYWMTYRQAAAIGAQVRKGERGTVVVHAGTYAPKDDNAAPVDDETITRTYLKRYVVFNVEQIDGLDLANYPKPIIEIANRDQRDAELEAAFQRYPVTVTEGGSSAFYRSDIDSIQMPKFDDFTSANAFYATLAHECIHSTGHKGRLDRDSLRHYGEKREIRAFEELIAEIGAAMVCAQLGMEPTEREDHAAYVAEWLKALRNDKRAIFRAASAAQAASEYMLAYISDEPVRAAA